MVITYFMRLGLISLAAINPVLSLILSNMMLKWEERGIICAEATAKNCIRVALTALAAYMLAGLFLILVAFAVLVIVQLRNAVML